MNVQLDLIHWIFTHCQIIQFLLYFESCFWAEFFFWLTCVQKVCICWINFTMLFWCFFFFLSFERSLTILLSLSIRVCHLTSVNFLMICCFFLFCCWDLSMISDLTEFLCLLCTALTFTVQFVIKMTADEWWVWFKVVFAIYLTVWVLCKEFCCCCDSSISF